MLNNYDLSLKLSKEEAAARLQDAQERLMYLRLVAGGILGEDRSLGPPLCVVFEGWDASGKGGAIKRLVSPLDPRHYTVHTFAAPTDDEKRHHFLARFWKAIPGWGGMTVLDRSWYGRVLVERVEKYATDEQWGRAYEEIRNFENTLVDEGVVLIKFWMHISDKEQGKRFTERANNPLKSWKLTDEDVRNREKRADYELAVEEMLQKTDTVVAPWNVIEGENKRHARVKVVEHVNDSLEKALLAKGFKLPLKGMPLDS